MDFCDGFALPVLPCPVRVVSVLCSYFDAVYPCFFKRCFFLEHSVLEVCEWDGVPAVSCFVVLGYPGLYFVFSWFVLCACEVGFEKGLALASFLLCLRGAGEFDCERGVLFVGYVCHAISLRGAS